MISTKTLSVLILGLLLSKVSCNNGFGNETDNVKLSCDFYMAESTIPNAGFGMFTTKDISSWDDVLYPEIVLQIGKYFVNVNIL